MIDRIHNVLFLCTGNSARSVMAEALLNVLGNGRFRAYSTGSHPVGKVQPMAVELAAKIGYDTNNLRSKSWNEFTSADAPQMDLVITVCDNAARETCPVWLDGPIAAHWGVDDPAAVEGDEPTRRHAYFAAFSALRRRVELLTALPLDKFDRLTMQQQVRDIGQATP
jgi:arsenate reductase